MLLSCVTYRKHVGSTSFPRVCKPWFPNRGSRLPVEHQARKRHINMNFFVRLVLGRPRVCPGDFTGFVPGTNPEKTSDKAGFSPYFTQWKPNFTGFVPGTNPVCPWDNPGDEGRRRKFTWKRFMCLFRALEQGLKWCKKEAKRSKFEVKQRWTWG